MGVRRGGGRDIRAAVELKHRAKGDNHDELCDEVKHNSLLIFVMFGQLPSQRNQTGASEIAGKNRSVRHPKKITPRERQNKLLPMTCCKRLLAGWNSVTVCKPQK